MKKLFLALILLISINSYAQESRLLEKYYKTAEIWMTQGEDTVPLIVNMEILIKVEAKGDVLIITAQSSIQLTFFIDRYISNEIDGNINDVLYSGVDENGNPILVDYLINMENDNRCIVVSSANYSLSYFIGTY